MLCNICREYNEKFQQLANSLLAQDFVAQMVEQRIILPSSYTEGDRFMQQLYQDSMAILRHFGRPTLCITFTANPKWKAILDDLLPGQTAVN